ncbi:GlsB/YeaQ/YmgE family stress response membrane protein [Actinoplanes sp. NPDC051851]|uniref:GlsB/YeaQ/YmgE family stress response membrane protein n=1 Tax=Actinoplanes sp. NPDC051851 TaxID=3154753 RepID=UPI003431157C
MTAISLVTAVTVGLATGLVGRFVTTRGRGAPIWLPLCVGVGASVFATVLTRLGGDATQNGPSVVEVLFQVLCAGGAVALVVSTADRRPGGLR